MTTTGKPGDTSQATTGASLARPGHNGSLARETGEDTKRGTVQVGATAIVADTKGRALFRLHVEIARIDWDARLLHGTVRRYRGAPLERVTYELVSGRPALPARAETHGVLSRQSIRNLSRRRLERAQGILPGTEDDR